MTNIHKWVLAFVVFLVFVLSAGCGNQTKNAAPGKAPEAAEAKVVKPPEPSEMTSLGQNQRLIREERESQVFMIMGAKHGEAGYIVKIFDDEKKVIYEARVPKVNNYEPRTKMVDDNIVQIRQGRGSGFWVCSYYDRKNNRVSPVYHNPLLAGYGKVVFPISDNTKKNKIFSGVAVSDIFDKDVFYKELAIEDLPPYFNVFKEVKWIGANKLSVTYLTEEKIDGEFQAKTVIFDLNE